MGDGQTQEGNSIVICKQFKVDKFLLAQKQQAAKNIARKRKDCS